MEWQSVASLTPRQAYLHLCQPARNPRWQPEPDVSSGLLVAGLLVAGLLVAGLLVATTAGGLGMKSFDV